MRDDPIVEEIHRIREQLLAEHGGSLEAFMKECQRRTEEAARAGRKVVAPPSLPLMEQPATKKAG
jgi:hypothetical protein